MADTKISDLTELTAPAVDDLLAIVEDPAVTPVTKRVTLGNVLSGWQLIETSKYTATPASTSTITFSDTGDVKVGLPCRYTYGGTTYYGIITAVTTDTLVTIAGAPLNTGQDLTEFSIGGPAQIYVLPFFISGPYGDVEQDLFVNELGRYFRWAMSAARLVSFELTHNTADSGTQPKVNAKVAGASVSTNDTNLGVQLSTAGTWVANPAVEINTTNYVVARNDALEVALTAAGSIGDSDSLSGNLIFVLE